MAKKPDRQVASSAVVEKSAVREHNGMEKISVPVRNVYHVLRLIRELGDIEAFLTECERKGLKLDVSVELANFAKMRLAETAPSENSEREGSVRFESIAMARSISNNEDPDFCPCLND